MNNAPFSDLKVIELASVLAGPTVGMFFAELGAEVIKIENPRTGGDVTRQWRLPSENADSTVSAYYAAANWGKKSIFADLTRPEEQKKIHALLQNADIVIVNFKYGDDKKMAMDYASLQQVNPRLIYAQITAFADNDPRTAFDVILQAESGFMYMNGEPEQQPVKMPVAMVDLLAAHQLKQAILIALLQRNKTQMGCHVKVSLIDAALASLANQATNWLMAGHLPQKMGTLHPNIAPYGDMFETKDKKQIVLAVGNDRQFEQLCKVLGNAKLSSDTRFSGNTARVKNRKSLQNALKLLIEQYPCEELIAVLTQKQVPVGRVRNMKEVFELPEANRLILTETLANEEQTKCLKTFVAEMR